MSFSLLPDEELLPLHLGGFHIIQKKRGFRFGLDAVLLADFCRAGARDRVCELGCGCGVIPLILAANTSCPSITAAEIQPAYADMAARSVAGNGLSARIAVRCGDYRDPALLGAQAFSLVVANPPYQKIGGGPPSPSDERNLACAEYNATLCDVADTAARLLPDGGRFCMIYRPERLCEAIAALEVRALPVKRLRFAHRSPEAEPSLVLIESKKGARSGVRVMPPLFLCDGEGESAELAAIYRRDPIFEKRRSI